MDGAESWDADSPQDRKDPVAGGSATIETKVVLDKNGMPKKKRKQLVACDSCRLRRVKCNKADIPGNGDCSSCAQKGIKCTDSYIRTKPKIVRSGKLIQQAKLLYGDGDPELDAASNSSGDVNSNEGGRRMSHPGAVMRAAEARFLNAELAKAISNSLLDTYHEVIHVQLPVVDWDHFQKHYEAAGRDSENLPTSLQVLSLVMQAWGARFSDHPSILGNNAPRFAELKDETKRDFTQYGQVRDSFAKAMVDRAVRVMDEKGVMRSPTAAAAAALMLLEFLMTYGDVYRSTGRPMLVAAVEHLRSINEGLSEDKTEVISPTARMGGDTLFWMVYTRDALSSAFGGRSTCLTQEDLTVLCELITQPLTANVGQQVASTDPRSLSGLAVISLFRHLTTITRSCVTHVSGPVARRRQYNIAAVEQMWRELDQSIEYSATFADSVNATELAGTRHANIWFRDLSAMRAQLSHSIHLSIVDRLEVESRTKELNSHDPNYVRYIFALEKLKDTSSIRFLRAIREVANMYKSYGQNLVLLGGMACENIHYYMEHMILMPEYELGGPTTWGATQKYQELHWLIDACKQLGWCWPELKRQLDRTYAYLDEHFGDGRSRLLPQTQQVQKPSVALPFLPNSAPPLYPSDSVSTIDVGWSTSREAHPPVEYSTYSHETGPGFSSYPPQHGPLPMGPNGAPLPDNFSVYPLPEQTDALPGMNGHLGPPNQYYPDQQQQRFQSPSYSGGYERWQ